MSKQDSTQVSTLQRPANDDKEAWKAYWNAQNQAWRTEPEIDVERQDYLAERSSIKPDIEKGIYPFKNIKLSRADVEWLLTTLENGRGPINWNDESQRKRIGLDLRGAILNKANLSGLPLACMLGGLSSIVQATSTGEAVSTTTDQRAKAAVHMEGTDLFKAHLEGANFSRGHLNRANMRYAFLKKAKFNYAHLENAYLSRSHLENAILRGCHLQGTSLHEAHLEGAELRRTIFNNETYLEGIYLGNQEYGYALLADISWGDANLTVVDWGVLKVLGDEQVAHQWKAKQAREGEKKESLEKYRSAVRAYRQLAVALQGQGMNEHAARFNYRAQLLQGKVFWYQHKFGQYLFSLFLDLLAGYGYKPWRSFLAYLLVIITFATTYFIIGHKVGPVLSPLGSLVFSMTSFHGRGFFPGGITLDDPLTVVAALEAFIGLLIEVTFIATLTQRLFGK